MFQSPLVPGGEESEVRENAAVYCPYPFPSPPGERMNASIPNAIHEPREFRRDY
jgi:hypothetical protein